jgi:hypothetical protein
MNMSNERMMAGLRLAAGIPEEEPYTLEEALASIAKESGYRVIPRGAYVPERPGDQIYAAMIEAMREVGAVAKLGEYKESKDGPVQYRFRGVDAVVNAAGPAFRKAGIIPTPTLLAADRTPGTTARGGSKMTTVLRVRYDFFAVDGSSISVVVEGEANDTSDKGTGKAFSVAYRIALLQLLAIPTDDPDPDAVRIEGDHTPPLSGALAGFVAAGILNDPIERLEALWHLLTAHVQPDSRVPDDTEGRVWWELFAERYRGEVMAAETQEALGELWRRYGQFGRTFKIGREGDVGQLITNRVKEMQTAYKAALTECAELINGADDTVALDLAVEVVRQHLSAHRIKAEDSLMYFEEIAKKRDQFRTQQDEPEPGELAAAPADEANDDQGDGEGRDY